MEIVRQISAILLVLSLGGELRAAPEVVDLSRAVVVVSPGERGQAEKMATPVHKMPAEQIRLSEQEVDHAFKSKKRCQCKARYGNNIVSLEPAFDIQEKCITGAQEKCQKGRITNKIRAELVNDRKCQYNQYRKPERIAITTQ